MVTNVPESTILLVGFLPLVRDAARAKTACFPTTSLLRQHKEQTMRLISPKVNNKSEEGPRAKLGDLAVKHLTELTMPQFASAIL